MDSQLARMKLPIPCSLWKEEHNAESNSARTKEMAYTLEAFREGDSVKNPYFRGFYSIPQPNLLRAKQKDQLEKCEPRPVVELSTREKIERAKQKKNKGSKYFSEKDFQPALQEYGIGIDVLKMVDYASDNASVDDKAQVIALLIPCYNNLAICHLRLKHFPDAYVAATSVITLCDGLEKMTDRSLVECLELHGVSKECLFTRWLGKGLYSAGKAKLNCHDYEESVVLLQRALKISEGNGMEVQEIRKLLSNAQRYAAKNHKQQKRMWSHAFKSTEMSEDTSTTTKPKKYPISNGSSNTVGAQSGIPSISKRRKNKAGSHSNSSNEGLRDGQPSWWRKAVPIVAGTAAIAVIGTIFIQLSRRNRVFK